MCMYVYILYIYIYIYYVCCFMCTLIFILLRYNINHIVAVHLCVCYSVDVFFFAMILPGLLPSPTSE
jgi:hypothetical protein